MQKIMLVPVHDFSQRRWKKKNEGKMRYNVTTWAGTMSTHSHDTRQ